VGRAVTITAVLYQEVAGERQRKTAEVRAETHVQGKEGQKIKKERNTKNQDRNRRLRGGGEGKIRKRRK